MSFNTRVCVKPSHRSLACDRLWFYILCFNLVQSWIRDCVRNPHGGFVFLICSFPNSFFSSRLLHSSYLLVYLFLFCRPTRSLCVNPQKQLTYPFPSMADPYPSQHSTIGLDLHSSSGGFFNKRFTVCMRLAVGQARRTVLHLFSSALHFDHFRFLFIFWSTRKLFARCLPFEIFQYFIFIDFPSSVDFKYFRTRLSSSRSWNSFRCLAYFWHSRLCLLCFLFLSALSVRSSKAAAMGVLAVVVVVVVVVIIVCLQRDHRFLGQPCLSLVWVYSWITRRSWPILAAVILFYLFFFRSTHTRLVLCLLSSLVFVHIHNQRFVQLFLIQNIFSTFSWVRFTLKMIDWKMGSDSNVCYWAGQLTLFFTTFCFFVGKEVWFPVLCQFEVLSLFSLWPLCFGPIVKIFFKFFKF